MIATRDEMLKIVGEFVEDCGSCIIDTRDWREGRGPINTPCRACWFSYHNNGSSEGCTTFCGKFSKDHTPYKGRKVLIKAIKDGRLAWWEGALRVVEEG